MRKRQNIVIGEKFGRLCITKDLGAIKGRTEVIAVCECGITKQYRFRHLKDGRIKSCGCLGKELLSKRAKTHGLTGHPLFRIVYQSMKQRCYYKAKAGYKYYGGRGVRVCDEWKNNFSSFYNWAIENGWQEGKKLDLDKAGMVFCPEYCSFITREESSNRTLLKNKIKNQLVTAQNKIKNNPVIQFIGTKFNLLTIVSDEGMSNNRRMVAVKCDCGSEKKIGFATVKNGTAKSCGCLRVISNKKMVHRTTHGLVKHPLYRVWVGVRKRCYNSKCPEFKNYGGRGVTMCDEWREDFLPFYEWAISNGYKKGLELDKDKFASNEGGKVYSPEFCSFISRDENAKYRRSNISIHYNGEEKCLSQWCIDLGLHYFRTYGRLRQLNWSVNKAFSTQ